VDLRIPAGKTETKIMINKIYRITISLILQERRSKGKSQREEKAWKIDIEGRKVLK